MGIGWEGRFVIVRPDRPWLHFSASAKSGPPNEPPKPAPSPPPGWRRWLLPVGLLITVAVLLVPGMLAGPTPTPLSYSSFVTKVDAGQVRSVAIEEKGAVNGTLAGGKTFTSQIPTALNSSQLEQRLQSKGVQIKAPRSSIVDTASAGPSGIAAAMRGRAVRRNAVFHFGPPSRPGALQSGSRASSGGPSLPPAMIE